MSTSLTTNQKTQAIIGIANLVQNHRINNSLQRLQVSALEANRLQEETTRNTAVIAGLQSKANNLQSKANQTAKIGIELQKIDITLQETERKRILLKEEEEARLRSELNEKKDAIYHARVDSEEIVESEVDAVEKFFTLNSMLASLMDAKIESKDFSSFEDKKFADDTHKNINSFLDEVNQNLTDEQSRDVKTITEILYIDEEEKIKSLDSQLKEIQKEIAKLEGLIAKNKKAEKKVIDDNQGRGTKEKTKEKELDAKFFERLTHLYFKHRTKKKLFGSSMKLDKANFWKEVGSLEWARKGFGMSKKHLSNPESTNVNLPKDVWWAKDNIFQITKECAKEMEDKKTRTIKSDYTIEDLEKNVQELSDWETWAGTYSKKLRKKYGYVYLDIEKKKKAEKAALKKKHDAEKKAQTKVQKEVKTLQSKLEPLNSDLEKNKIQEKEVTMEINKYETTIEDEKEIVTALEQKYPFIHTIVANR